MSETEQNGNGEHAVAEASDEGPRTKSGQGLPNVIYTHEELEFLLGKAQARQIFELRESASRIHPTREAIVMAFKVCGRTGPLPTLAEMRAAGPAFVAWLRATNANPEVRQRDEANSFTKMRSFDAFRAWIRTHYPEDYATVKSGRVARRIDQKQARELREQGMKWCPECETAKPFGDFNLHNAGASKGGYQSYCRTCNKNREQARREQRALNLPPVPSSEGEDDRSVNSTQIVAEGVTHAIQAR